MRPVPILAITPMVTRSIALTVRAWDMLTTD